jgi:hypothetical protein
MAKPPSKKANEQAGRIRLTDGMICYNSAFFGSWEFPASIVSAFGEDTTDQGPMIDDWFMVIVPDAGDGWLEASVYAEGADVFRADLAKALGTESLYGELFAHTDFASRVIWPTRLAGKPLFDFKPVPMPWWKRLVRLGSEQIQFALSPDVQAVVSKPT